jgi:CheY-like chemotaxis protein
MLVTMDAPIEVLIVDDDRATRDLLSLQAVEGDLHLRALAACDGEEALELLREHPQVRLILLDLGMPTLDGFGFLSALQEARGDAPPVVVITARDLTPSDARRLRALGAVRFIQKGRYDTQGLVDLIAALLS